MKIIDINKAAKLFKMDERDKVFYKLYNEYCKLYEMWMDGELKSDIKVRNKFKKIRNEYHKLYSAFCYTLLSSHMFEGFNTIIRRFDDLDYSIELISIDSLFYSMIGEVNANIIMNNGVLSFDKVINKEFQKELETEI